MKTRRLFKEDVYLTTCRTKIRRKFLRDGQLLLALEETLFFPTGGGQSCDVGTIGDLHVVDVFEEDEDILHACLETDSALQIGDEVEISIDWAHRFDNMQRHCGEHILSGKFYELYGGVNRGFHMGEEYMTIDIALEENPAYDKVTWEMAQKAELATNQAIWADLPVITRHFDRREEAEALPLRKALAFDEDITIVCVGAVENPADCVACCGTHPSTAGQVGMVKIYKVESNKGMFRVYFEAGQRAFRQYQARFDVLTTLENQLSAGFDDLLQKYAAQQEKTKAVRDQLYHLKKWIVSREIDEIKDAMGAAFVAGNPQCRDAADLGTAAGNGQCKDTAGSFFVRKYDKLSIDDILSIGRGLSGCIPAVAFLVHEPTNTVLLFTDKYDAGKLVKDNAAIYNGKGGGNKNSARAIFPKAEYVDTYIDLIEKHLR